MLLAGIAALAVTLSASAQPPPGADPNSEIGKWFKSLKNEHGLPCCDVSDCRRVQARLMEGHYEAMIDEQWASVPDSKIRHVANPTGEYIACYTYYDGTRDPPPLFFCFVPISLAMLEPYRELDTNWLVAAETAKAEVSPHPM
jgi:hypothetical protein